MNTNQLIIGREYIVMNHGLGIYQGMVKDQHDNELMAFNTDNGGFFVNVDYNGIDNIIEIRPKRELYKTAQTLVACAEFGKGEFVSVKYYHTDENNVDWFLIGRHGNTVYPANHLTRFTL